MEEVNEIKEIISKYTSDEGHEFHEAESSKITDLLEKIEAKYSEKEMELDEANSLKQEAESKLEEEKVDQEETHNKWCDSIIDPNTVYDQEKGEIVKRLYDQLTLEQLTNLEKWLVKNNKINMNDLRYQS